MSKSIEQIAKELRQPFEAHDVKWRAQQSGFSGQGKPYMMMIPYIDARAIQRRFDEVMGIGGWKDELKPIENGFLCGISLKLDGDWITKWDGASNTNIEPIKGGISGAKKRAAAEWGVGQYLYNMKDSAFANCWIVDSYSASANVAKVKNKKTNQSFLVAYEEPVLPSEFLPQTDYTPFLSAISEAESMEGLHAAFKSAYLAAQTNDDSALEDQAIAAKDRRKAELIKSRDDAISAEFQKVNKWLDSETAKFAEHNIASTLNSFAESTKELLRTKCHKSEFDREPLFAKLDAAQKAALKNLKK